MSRRTREPGRISAEGPSPRSRGRLLLGAVCTLVIGIYVGSAHSGIFELLGSAAADNYYNLLVRGFQAGQLSLKTEVPAGLAELPDPFDPNANTRFRLMAGHPLWDLSYYGGRLYLYFGVTPAVVLFWPYAVITGHYLLHREAVVIFCAIGFLAGANLIRLTWRRYFAQVGVGIVAAGMLALGLATGIPAILQRSDVYEVPISCGYALKMMALTALWMALHKPSARPRWLALASLLFGLGLGARPSLLFGAAILLLPVWQAWREGRRLWTLLLAAIVPMACVGVGLMIYNALRFDTPFEFGTRYMLAGQRQDAAQLFSLRYFWFNFHAYFLSLAGWTSRFPFVHAAVLPALPTGYAQAENVFGVLSNTPLVWLALAAPLAWQRESGEARAGLRWFVGALVLLFAAGTVTLLLFFAACLRYEMEFLPELMLLAVMGIFGVERALGGRPVWLRSARWGWGLLLAGSTVFNLLAGFDRRAEADYNLGFTLLQNGHIDEAIPHLEGTLALHPDNQIAHANLAVALLARGRTEEAIRHYQRAVELEPDFCEVRFRFGHLLAEQGRFAEAIPHLRRVIALQPDAAAAWYDLATVLLENGQVAEAVVDFEKALALQPRHGQAHGNLGSALLREGRLAEAIDHFRKALEIQPDNVIVQNNWAWLLATCPDPLVRDGRRAVDLATRADQLCAGTNPRILRTLAAAAAETGRFADAIATARRAMELAGTQNRPQVLRDLQIEVVSYEAGSPFRDTNQPIMPLPFNLNRQSNP